MYDKGGNRVSEKSYEYILPGISSVKKTTGVQASWNEAQEIQY